MLTDENYEDEAIRYSRYISENEGEYGEHSEITQQEIQDDLKMRYPTTLLGFGGGFPNWLERRDVEAQVNTCLDTIKVLHSTDVYRILHTFIYQSNLQQT